MSASQDQLSPTPIASLGTDMLYCPNTDGTDYNVYATLANPSSLDPDCTALSTDSLKSIEQVSFDNNGEESFALKYSSGTCSLQVNMVCDSNLATPVIGKLNDLGGECNFQTTFTGKEACASLDLSAIWDFFDENTWLWGTIFIVAGALVCFFGRIFFKATVFFATTLLVAAGILLLFYTTFLKSTTEDWVAWTVLISSVLIGCVAGFFAIKLERLGAALLAGWGGFMVGALINEIALYKVGSTALFWCVCIGCAIVAAILTFVIFDHVLIIMTSFAGAYSFWRGISLFAGGFPNEFTLAQEI